MIWAPGDKVYLDGEAVTVLADAGRRTFYIPGHYDYRVCSSDALQGEIKTK